MGRPPNNYSDTQKSAALIAYDICDNNAVRAAAWCKQHNGFAVSHDQVTRWVNGEYIAEDVRNNAKVKKGELSDKFEEIAHLCTDLAADKLRNKDESIAFEKLMTGGAIATDKMRLLREQATTITNAAITDEERLRELQELMQRLRQRQIEAQQGQVIDIEPEEKID